MDEREQDMLDEGERLQKIMARAGVGSRRRCEELISEGRVKVNGTVVRELGTRARADVDTVEVDGVNIGAGERIVHYAVYKPVGYVSTADDPEGRPKVVDLVPSTLRLYPVGRLDYDTEGLIIVTNDGHLTNVLTHPSHEINKTYLALVEGTPDDLAISKLRHGVALDDGMTAPARVRIIKPEGADTWVELTIHEGRNRQVRRMCEAVGHPVLKLIRTRIGRLNLAGLQPGKFRALSSEEVAMLEEQADPQGLGAEAESDDWALAESRGEKRPDATPAAAAKKEAKTRPAAGKAKATKATSARPVAGRPSRSSRPESVPREFNGARPKTGTWHAGEEGPARYWESPAGERPARREGPAKFGERPARREGPAKYGERPARREGPAKFGERPARREGPAKYGERPARREGSAKFGERPARREGPAKYGERPARREGPAKYGERPARREGPAKYGERPARREGPAKFGERPARGPGQRTGSGPRKSAAGLPKPAKRGPGPSGGRGRGPASGGNRRGSGRSDMGKGVRRNGSH